MSKRAAAPAADSVEGNRQRVADARARIVADDSEAQGLTKPSGPEVRQQIAAHVQATLAEQRERLGYKLRRAANGGGVHDLLAVTGSEGAAGLLAVLLGPDVVVSALCRLLPDELDARPDAKARAERLAEIERDSFEAGCAEEQAIRALEAQGVHAPRRADADPRAVLAD